MEFKSINPYNGQELATYKGHKEKEVGAILEKSQKAFQEWKGVAFSERAKLMQRAAGVMEEKLEVYAKAITLEMGKPISESRAEIEKCAWVCRFYAESAEKFLSPQFIGSDAAESFVRYDPMGAVLAIMPWNFPFWQVFRFAAPSLMAGNTGLLKHAANVQGCAAHIEDIFREAGFPAGVFQNLIVGHEQIESIIAHGAVKAVTLTGSERAGSSVAMLAGKYLKKTVLELGGSNAFIVCEDAEMDVAVKVATQARMINNGQSCIAAKRFILVGKAYEAFLPKFLEAVKNLPEGDPLLGTTKISCLARKDLAEQLQGQLKQSVGLGAKLLWGGEQKGAYHQPTVLDNVKPGMPAFDEETFGPLAAITKAKNEGVAFELAAKSDYGLGATIFTRDVEKAKNFAYQIKDGAFFINELVKSDPRLPFGGTGKSGYGRELAQEGIMEFVNKKTVYVK